jgi:hypothetical protein
MPGALCEAVARPRGACRALLACCCAAVTCPAMVSLALRNPNSAEASADIWAALVAAVWALPALPCATAPSAEPPGAPHGAAVVDDLFEREQGVERCRPSSAIRSVVTGGGARRVVVSVLGSPALLRTGARASRWPAVPPRDGAERWGYRVTVGAVDGPLVQVTSD